MSELFDQLHKVWGTSPEITTKTKPESLYMLNRFLSLHPDGFLPAVDCNRFVGLPDWAALQYIKYATPTMSAPRNTYPKKVLNGKKLTPKEKKALAIVCRHFHLSDFHGKQVLFLLKQQGINLDSN